jgi:hypothetical protein
MREWPGRGGKSSPRRPARRGLALLFVALLGTVLVASVAEARSSLLLPYPSTDIWAAVVRFLRVDRGFTIREKDEKAGYVLFDFAEGGRTYRASLELVSLLDDDGRASTEAQLAVPELPKRYEAVLLDQLASKVRQERGAPPPAKRRPTPVESPKDKDSAKPRPEPDGGLPRAPTLPAP